MQVVLAYRQLFRRNSLSKVCRSQKWPKIH